MISFLLLVLFACSVSAQLPNDTAVSAAVACTTAPPQAGYVLDWSCPTGALDGVVCPGRCAAGVIGSATATCQAGRWLVVNRCLVGGVYGFDDVTGDGVPVPTRFLGLVWTGMRAAAAASFTACGSYNGYARGVVSPPVVAYTLEAGAAVIPAALGNVSVAASSSAFISSPTPSQRISVRGLWVTAAWQEGLTLHISAQTADGRVLAVKQVQLTIMRPTYVDLTLEAGFTGGDGYYRLGLVGFGGAKVSCSGGTNVVVDSVDVRLHPDPVGSVELATPVLVAPPTTLVLVAPGALAVAP